ncbi:MAG: hypothetical protein JJU42_13700 [Rhodobacteraceae bacterium]|nr:hypothetical protein [Paracoccaceae bacterium]
MTKSNWVDLGAVPLAGENNSFIYPHPDDPGRLIKIPRALGADRKTPRSRLVRHLRKLKQKRRFDKGIARQGAAIRAYETSGHFCPIPLCFGAVQTRLGEGQVIEAIVDAKGNLGPTLRDLMRTGRLEPEHRSAVLHLMESACAHSLFVTDLQLHNIVWGTARGRTTLFIVDGLDDHAMFRPVGWFPERDRRSMQARWRQDILAPLGLSPGNHGHTPGASPPRPEP